MAASSSSSSIQSHAEAQTAIRNLYDIRNVASVVTYLFSQVSELKRRQQLDTDFRINRLQSLGNQLGLPPYPQPQGAGVGVANVDTGGDKKGDAKSAAANSVTVVKDLLGNPAKPPSEPVPPEIAAMHAAENAMDKKLVNRIATLERAMMLGEDGQDSGDDGKSSSNNDGSNGSNGDERVKAMLQIRRQFIQLSFRFEKLCKEGEGERELFAKGTMLAFQKDVEGMKDELDGFKRRLEDMASDDEDENFSDDEEDSDDSQEGGPVQFSGQPREADQGGEDAKSDVEDMGSVTEQRAGDEENEANVTDEIPPPAAGGTTAQTSNKPRPSPLKTDAAQIPVKRKVFSPKNKSGKYAGSEGSQPSHRSIKSKSSKKGKITTISRSTSRNSVHSDKSSKSKRRQSEMKMRKEQDAMFKLKLVELQSQVDDLQKDLEERPTQDGIATTIAGLKQQDEKSDAEIARLRVKLLETKTQLAFKSEQLEKQSNRLSKLQARVSNMDGLDDTENDQKKANKDDEQDKATGPKKVPLPVRIAQNKAVLNLHRDWITKNNRELGSMREWISRVRSLLRDNRNNGQFTSTLTDKISKQIDSLQKQIQAKASKTDLQAKANASDFEKIVDFMNGGRTPILSTKALMRYKCTSCERPILQLDSLPSKDIRRSSFPAQTTHSIAPSFLANSRRLVETMMNDLNHTSAQGTEFKNSSTKSIIIPSKDIGSPTSVSSMELRPSSSPGDAQADSAMRSSVTLPSLNTT